jgi:hypothetical protein
VKHRRDLTTGEPRPLTHVTVSVHGGKRSL